MEEMMPAPMHLVLPTPSSTRAATQCAPLPPADEATNGETRCGPER
jgi:hypothetical protein